MTAVATTPRLTPIDGDRVEQSYADWWHAAESGIVVRRGHGTVMFTGINQPWLRAAVKRWCRFRLAIGSAYNTIKTTVAGLIKFSRFLTEQHPDVIDISRVTRTLLEHYLSWMASSPWAINTRSNTLTMLRGFSNGVTATGSLPAYPPTRCSTAKRSPAPKTPCPNSSPSS